MGSASRETECGTLRRTFALCLSRVCARAIKSNNAVTIRSPAETPLATTLQVSRFLIYRTQKAMNSKKLILFSYVAPTVLAVSAAMAQGTMRTSAMHPAHRSSAAHAPIMTSSASALHRFSSRGDRFGRPGRFNDGDNDFDDRFRRFHRFNEIIVFNDFAFPFASPFFYPYYYPYGYYSYNQPVYGSAYSGGSIVVQVQSRLARAGYYRGPIDGVMGPRTRFAIRAYESAHNMRVDGAISRQLLATMGLRY